MATLAILTRLGYPMKLLWASCMNTFLTASGGNGKTRRHSSFEEWKLVGNGESCYWMNM